MPTGSKGLSNHISNMVAPQIVVQTMTTTPRGNLSKQRNNSRMKESGKMTKSFPPLPVLSSATDDDNNTDDVSKKSSRSIKLFTTPTKKPSIKLRKVIPEANEMKLVQVKSQQDDKDQDDMLTISSPSNKGYFSNYSSDDSKKEEDRKAKRTAFRIKCKQNKLK